MAGAALAAFDRIGLCHIPVGTGNTERLMRAIELLRPEAAVLTPSYAAHLVEWAAERGFDLRGSSVERVLVAGEPGGGEPAFRARLEEGWGARVTEAMGIGDIGVSLWGECEEQDGMHLGARGFVHAELIDPETGAARRDRRRRDRRARAHPPPAPRRAAAALPHARPRRRSGRTPCPCGRTGPRVRCIGRTDDMLIVRGVNVFPSAVREVVSAFAPDGQRPHPRPAAARRASSRSRRCRSASSSRAARRPTPRSPRRSASRLRSVLVVQTRVELVPWGSLQRSEYKSKLVEH